MRVLLFLLQIFTIERYEDVAIQKIRNIIETDIENDELNFFSFHKEEVVYFYLNLSDEEWNLVCFYDHLYSEHKVKVLDFTKPFDDYSKQIFTCIGVIRELLATDKCNKLIFVLKDCRTVDEQQKIEFSKNFSQDLKKVEFRNNLSMLIEVKTPEETKGLEHTYYPDNDFMDDKMVIKFNMSELHHFNQYDLYYYKVLDVNSEPFKNLSKEIELEYTLSMIESYVRCSSCLTYNSRFIDSTWQRDYSIYDMFPKDLDYSLKNEDIKEHPTHLNSEALKAFKQYYNGFTALDMKGVVVLFYQLMNNYTIFEEIINEIPQTLYSKEENPLVWDIITSIKSGNMPNIRITNEQISNIRPFLIHFFLNCQIYFASSLIPEILQMSLDFENNCVVRCFTDNSTVRKILIRVCDYITLIPHQEGEQMEKILKKMENKHGILIGKEYPTTLEHMKMWGLHNLTRKITEDDISNALNLMKKTYCLNK